MKAISLYWLLSILLVSFFLFLPGFFLYFHQDDFLHMAVSQRWDQVITAFTIFHHGEFPFYRPIPTQVYYFFLGSLFGFNPLPYHVVNFLIFSVNTWLVYLLVYRLLKKERAAVIGAGFYAINATHVAPLFAAAYVHELLYVCFALLTCLSFLLWLRTHLIRDYLWSVLAFVLTLMCKENAVILPGILFLLSVFENKNLLLKKKFLAMIPYGCILAVYLVGHFLFYGTAVSSSYQFIIGKQTVNILIWYGLWALSTPNILIDFIGPGFHFNTVFFQVAGIQGRIYSVLFPLLLAGIASLLFLFFRQKNPSYRLVALGGLWFVVGMIPLIVFPLHHLATEQAFSVIGLGLLLGTVADSVWRTHRVLVIAVIAVYLIVAANSIILARRTHWIVRSSQQAQRVLTFLKQKNIPDGSRILFLDGDIKIPAYGSSKQLHEALGEGKGINLILRKPHLTSDYEYLDPSIKESILPGDTVIDSSAFLGY